MEKKYVGIIIEESLTDNKVMTGIKITNTAVSPNDSWRMHAVEATEDDIARISHVLKPAYYAHFWKGREVIVAFKDKVFRLDYDRKETWKPAIDYGLSQGIPLRQLDFPIDLSDFQ